ncbi:hypothetical protein SOHN41_01671 [Shewanella sp. HN-41]|nr:hypothetical protein SOHN41_01671 [Shewanella sp. HN-41]
MGEHRVSGAINHNHRDYGFSAVPAKYLEFKFMSHDCRLWLRVNFYRAYPIGGG